MRSKDLKIFVSSTYLDLKEAREKIIKFLNVLNSDIIHMEVFGSDDTRPKDFVLSQVRQSNLFIGVYAERYGSIDHETGLSITELEYHEAFQLLSQGKMKGILLYSLAADASWNVSFVDRDPVSVEKLRSFKHLVGSRHMLTFFKDIQELPFNILSDTIRKLEIGSGNIFIPKEVSTISYRSHLDKPVGMEFFGSDLANIFFGRNKETEELCRQIIIHHFSLLIGISGIGKTSLLNAGVVPYFQKLGWLTAVCRPLTNPVVNLKVSLWHQFFTQAIPANFELIDVVKSILNVHSESKILIIIDQFEEVLYSKDKSNHFDYLINNLGQLVTNSNKKLHILISYRGDVESEIGYLWQKISGAPDGLPRFYLASFSKASASDVLSSTLHNLNLLLPQPLLEEIVYDLEVESKTNNYTGIFPPFLQMVIATLFENKSEQRISQEFYEKLGRVRLIIANYLLNQLDYLGTLRNDGTKVLTALVSNYGAKTQKTLSEIQELSGLNSTVLNVALEQLINLRLIRSIGETYEITHDLLADQMMKTVMTPDELLVRKFRQLIDSKTAVFEDTSSSLTQAELLQIYNFRHELRNLNKQQIFFILTSSISEKCPCIYWLKYGDYEEAGTSTLRSIAGTIRDDLNLIETGGKKAQPKAADFTTIPDVTEGQLVALSRKDKEEDVIRFFYNAKQYLKNIDSIDPMRMLKSKARWQQMLAVVYLGLNESKANTALLAELSVRVGYSRKVQALALKGYLNSAIGKMKMKEILSILNQYNGYYWDFIYEEVKERQVEIEFSQVTSLPRVNSSSDFAEFMFRFITAFNKDAVTVNLNELLTNSSFTKHSFPKEEYLRIFLEHATEKDFYPFIDFIKTTPHGLSVNYQSFLHEAFAKLATIDHYDYLKEQIEIILDNSNPHERITENSYNDYFLKWMLFSAFCRLCLPEDKPLLIKCLSYYLYTARLAAARALYRIGTEEDISLLFQQFFSKSTAFETEPEVLTALRFLDLKFYFSEDLKSSLNERYERLQKIESATE